MERITVLFLTALFILSSTLIFAQQQESLSKSDFWEIQRVESLLNPQVMERSAQASQVFQDRLNPSLDVNDYYQLATDIVKSKFKNLSPDEYEIIITKVLYNALQAVEQEIAVISSELSVQEKVKTELNNDIRYVARLHDEYKGKDPFARDSVISVFLLQRIQTFIKKSNATNDTKDIYFVLVGFYSAQFDGGTTIKAGMAVLDEMKADLDSMNELSEVTSLRLQMTLDRRYKFISTISQIMKTIATTQDTLIQNIK